MDEAEAAIFESGGLLTSRCRDQIDQVFGIYDANRDGWMALPEATAWRSTSRDGFTALRVPELLRVFDSFVERRWARVTTACGMSLGDFRELHRDFRASPDGASVVAQILYQQESQRPIEEGSGLYPESEHEVGERVSVCRLARLTNSYGIGDVAAVVGTSGELSNKVHIGYLVADQRGLPAIRKQGICDARPLGYCTVPHEGDVCDLQVAAVAGSQPTFCTASSTGQVWLYSPGDQDGEPSYTKRLIHQHSLSATSVAWGQGNGILASGSEDGTIQLYDPRQDYQQLSSSGASDSSGRESTHIHAMQWDPEGVQELLVATASGCLRLYDTRQSMSRPVRNLLEAQSSLLSLSARSGHFAVGTATGQVFCARLRDPAQSLVQSTHADEVPVWSVALRGGSQMFFSAGADGKLMQHGDRRWKLADTYNLSMNSLDLQPESGILVAGSDAETLQFFQLGLR